jgi:hypothetical protein
MGQSVCRALTADSTATRNIQGVRTSAEAPCSGPRPTLCRLQGIILTTALIMSAALLECIRLSGVEVESLVTHGGVHKT